MNINSTSASAASNISSLVALTGGADASEMALMYAQLLQIDDSHAKLNDLVKELDQNSTLQHALRDRMDKLSRMKDIINQAGDGEGETKHMTDAELAVRLYGSDADIKAFENGDFVTFGALNFAPTGAKLKPEWQQKLDTWREKLYADYPMTRDTLSINKATGGVSVGKGDQLGSKTPGIQIGGAGGGRTLSVGTLSQYVTELKGQSEELSNAAQQLNLFTQSAVNAVQRATTFVSGLLKSMHDTNMAPIRKIG